MNPEEVEAEAEEVMEQELARMIAEAEDEEIAMLMRQ